MDWWTTELNAALTNAYNGTWWLGCYYITAVMLYLRHITLTDLPKFLDLQQNPEVKHKAELNTAVEYIKKTAKYQLGISLVSFGTGTIRLWWLIGKSAAPEGANFAFWAPQFSGLLFPFVVMIAIGYAYHQEEFAKSLAGQYWWVPFFFVCAAGALLGLILGHSIG